MNNQCQETNLDLWKLHDNLTVVQASLLINYFDPAEGQEYVLSSTAQNRPNGFDAVFSALTNAIDAKKLKATLRYDVEKLYGIESVNSVISCDKEIVDSKQHGSLTIESQPDWNKSTVDVEDLKQWLILRNFKSGFFFDNATQEPDYLNRNHPHYCHKLEAAIKAWEGVCSDSKY